MKVEVEDLSPVLKKLSVQVPADTVDKALDRAYRLINRKAKIRGFRPGKVPRRILEQHFSQQVAHDVADDLVRETYPQAVEEGKIEPVALPNVEEGGHVKKGEAWSYCAKVEVLAPIKVTDYAGLEVSRTEVKVTSEEIDEELERIRMSMSQLVPVTDRDTVEQGDFVLADMKATLDGKDFLEGSGEDVTFEVSDGEVTRGHLPQAAGAKVGSTVKIEQDFDDDHPAEKVRGKHAVFEAQIKQIKVRQLPEIDDELAKDLGEEGIDNLLALRGHIREQFTVQRRDRADKELKDNLIKALVEKNPIDVPTSVVDRTAESMIRPIVESMMRSGVTEEALQQSLDVEGLLQEARPSAEIVVKGALLLEAVAAQEELEITDSDLRAHYDKLAAESNQPVEKVRAALTKDPSQESSLKRQLREEKAFAFIKERASISEKKAAKKTSAKKPKKAKKS